MSVRIYELARELGLANKELVAKVRGLGIEVRNHMSAIELEDSQRVKRALEKERAENRDEKRLSSTVIRRRSRVVAPRAPARPAGSALPAAGSVLSAAGSVLSAAGSVLPAAGSVLPAAGSVLPAAKPAPPVEAEDGVAEDAAGATGPAGGDDGSTAALEAAEAGERAVVAADVVDTDVVEEAIVAPLTGDTELSRPRTERPAAAAVTEPPETTGEVSNMHVAEVDESAADAGSLAPGVIAEGGQRIREQAEDLVETPGLVEAEDVAWSDDVARGGEVQAEKPVSAKVEVGVGGRHHPEGPSAHRYQVRYAPGFEPGGKYAKAPPGRYGQPLRAGGAVAGAAPVAGGAAEEQPMSAAEAARMMSPAKPKVVITDLDARRGSLRREVTRAELFKDRRFRQQQQRGRRKKVPTKQKGRKTEITTPAEHKRVIRVAEAIGVGEIARQMGVKAAEVLKKLWGMGLTTIMINQSIDADTASLLASEFGYEVEDVAFKEDVILHEAEDRLEDMQLRAPVITVMGHVDHGKTSVLDVIRHSDVASGEAGGITQHIGAYRVETPQGEFVFLDTPGHEAFTHMRARGAQCTDLVVLVVAADDGVMPQTAEAIDHARAAGVPIIVAINKIDLPSANPDRVKSELAERDLIPEEWGGNTQVVEVSAKTKQGIDALLEALALQAEVLELKANPDRVARGTVIEAKLDRARGCMCTVLVQEGTLRVGDTVVSGEHVGKVRAMLDHRGRPLKDAPPSTPVEVLGLGGVPSAGDTLVVADEKAARQVAEHRRKQSRERELALTSGTKTYEQILGEIQSGEARELKVVLKADVQGSAEAIKDALLKLSTHKVTVVAIASGVGGIAEADVNLARASGAVVLGFAVRPAGKAAQLAEREGVEIRIYDVIYEMLDDVKVMMQGLLPKERKERFAGRAEVRETFTIPKLGVVAGCSVTDGKLVRGAHLRLIRDSVKVHDSRIGGLRRFKDDVREVEKGYECGVAVEGFNDIQVGDVIEAYEIEEVAASLS